MSTAKFQQAQLAVTSGVFALVVLHLGWELMRGGVVSHHFLARADMPSISNWWGLVLVPALAWFVAGRVLGRGTHNELGDGLIPANIRRALPAFCGALVYGGIFALSFAFAFGVERYLVLAPFAIGVVLPIYRGEYILGFVLGMMFTFGGILPMFFAAVFATFSWLARTLSRSAMRLAGRFKRG
ncbi:hypothetical protein [Thioalkalivibrio sp. XN279]|uniref:hypothetical protein n=1 Tax=Thioalkalivibrio sp. XN279 TaxID=2714953 RepID=UPI00140B9652|nr:hypothetical protein [Thioalkalivibrio sp. XN279]NHA14850.1 hypothetical protein [Thioalkalivibrio sp. XN279]